MWSITRCRSLKDFKHIILVEAREPVAFFAYPNKPSMLKPEGCEVHQHDRRRRRESVAALEALADAVGAKPADVKPQKHRRDWSSRPAR